MSHLDDLRAELAAMRELHKAVKYKDNPDYILDPATKRYKRREPKAKKARKPAAESEPAAPVPVEAPLQGSDKQVTWASDIRRVTTQYLRSSAKFDEAERAELLSAAAGKLDAKWWIDHREYRSPAALRFVLLGVGAPTFSNPAMAEREALRRVDVFNHVVAKARAGGATLRVARFAGIRAALGIGAEDVLSEERALQFMNDEWALARD